MRREVLRRQEPQKESNQQKKEGARKICKSLEGFSTSFSKVSFWEKNFLDMFWGSFKGVKTYSEQKRFMGQDFEEFREQFNVKVCHASLCLIL